MKRITRISFCVIAIIIISILFCQIACYAEHLNNQEKIQMSRYTGVITQYKTKAAEEFLWKTLSSMIDNEKIVENAYKYTIENNSFSTYKKKLYKNIEIGK